MKILIIYSTTSGNTQIVLDAFQDALKDAGIEHVIQRAEQTKHIEPEDFDVFVFACGTYGHGMLQERMRIFVERRTNDLDLGGKPCAVIGLGDDKYDKEYNIEAAVVLEKYVEKWNGRLMIDSLKINKSPLRVLNSTIKDWSELFIKKLGNE